LTDAEVSRSLLEEGVLFATNVSNLRLRSYTETKGLIEDTHLCCLLARAGLSLREGGGGGLLSFGWLSLRKENHQHI
jgi:hypothetical protein